jgi:uncharacterized protein YodC (DUF2158 family)
MEKPFAIGETVKLKSGSPVMTVKEYDGETGEVVCVWHDQKKNEFSEQCFPAALLSKFKGGPSIDVV